MVVEMNEGKTLVDEIEKREVNVLGLMRHQLHPNHLVQPYLLVDRRQ
jgi:hypothetical protein